MTRVVSLLPAATEIVAALGALESLVGITHECDHPAGAAARARVTRSLVDGREPPRTVDTLVRSLAAAGAPLCALDEPRIRGLRPDVILTQGLCDVCAVAESDVRALAARLSPPPRITALSATTLDGVLDDIANVADALSLRGAGERLLAGLRARMAAVHGTLAAARAPRPRVAMIEWTDPIFAGGHWVPAMIRRAGGADVLAREGSPSRVVAPGAISAADPDVVLVAPCGYGLDRAATEARRLVASPDCDIPETTAVWALDGNALTSRPGPRLVDGIEVMARIFNPGLFTPVDPSLALCVRQPFRARAGASSPPPP